MHVSNSLAKFSAERGTPSSRRELAWDGHNGESDQGDRVAILQAPEALLVQLQHKAHQAHQRARPNRLHVISDKLSAVYRGFQSYEVLQCPLC